MIHYIGLSESTTAPVIGVGFGASFRKVDAVEKANVDQCCDFSEHGDLEMWHRIMQWVLDDGYYPVRLTRGVAHRHDGSYTENASLQVFGARDIRSSFQVPAAVMKRKPDLHGRRVEMWQSIGVELGKTLGAFGKQEEQR